MDEKYFEHTLNKDRAITSDSVVDFRVTLDIEQDFEVVINQLQEEYQKEGEAK